MKRQKIVKIVCMALVMMLLVGMFLTGCTSEIEQIHAKYKELRAETNPTMETVKEIARLRLRLIELVGEEEQQRLIGEWNNE